MNHFSRHLIFTLLLLGSSSIMAEAGQLKVATYNLRLKTLKDNNSGNGWEQRSPYIADLVRYHDFEIFGTQEGLDSQIHDLDEMLPAHSYIGVGRDDGKKDGEYAAIFYRPDLFELIDHGDFWLSPTPDKPSKGWDAACKRVCTWGRFKDKRTGLQFIFANLHMDHKGVTARRESSQLVLARISDIAFGLPVILTGDFNIDQYNESYKLLNDSPLLNDAYEKAAIRFAPNGTFNGFNADSFTDSRIDHIFISPAFEVERYGILTDTYRTLPSGTTNTHNEDFPDEVHYIQATPRVPSDHFPVAVTLHYPDSIIAQD